MRLKPLALAAVVALTFFAAPSAHAFNVTASAGGTGGLAHLFSVRCSADQVMVGIITKVSTFVDSVRPYCATVNSDGVRTTTPTESTQFAGGVGGSEVRMICPAGQVVSGILGRSGDLIDRLQILCSGMTAGRLRETFAAVPGGGGTGGTSFGPFRCANSEPGQGLRGAFASVITWIALVCNLPTSLAQSDAIENRGLFVPDVTTPGGGPAIARITFHNHTSAALNVPWRVLVNGTEAGARTDAVPANSIRTFELNVNVPGGRSRLVGEADPANILSEVGFQRFNNAKTFDIVVPEAAPRVPFSCSSGVPVVNSEGTFCAIGADVSSCSAPSGPGGLGPRESFRCSLNSDCLSNFVCSTNPCGGVCVRKPNP